jgi:hypothetical protein
MWPLPEQYYAQEEYQLRTDWPLLDTETSLVSDFYPLLLLFVAHSEIAKKNSFNPKGNME